MTGLEDLTLLERLELQYNHISRVEGVSHLKYLKHLNLEKNQISTVGLLVKQKFEEEQEQDERKNQEEHPTSSFTSCISTTAFMLTYLQKQLTGTY